VRADPHSRGLAAGLREGVEAAIGRPGVVRTLFQPIVDLSSATVTGYEALTRFELEPRMSPDLWFQAAYELGMGPDLEAVALASALRGRAVLPPNCFLTVNLGPEAVLTPEVQAVLTASGDLRGLVIELTEQAPVDDYPALLEVLAPLREAGPCWPSTTRARASRRCATSPA
jgi:EAL domain-containing protein (putative c-di-GMP-specific phosphodiesterase class I)